eukprot:TRINITY_DN65349_c0_g1_i1.p1 TRINITY_DN65349_c0_g1~~TRINITY_DN65349_c0_g1_i1.p1  ORF type:complete len:136 (-),score=16.25 TRINITY_DN65349_c0_g1_i1:95-502(-)
MLSSCSLLRRSPSVFQPAVRRRWFYGPVQKHIEEKIQSTLDPIHLQVKNESHGKASDESHFHVLVVSDAFEGRKQLERHRLVNQLFTNEDGSLKFHSLRVTAKTPSVWQTDASVPSAPKCTGKGDGRKPTDAEGL